jgi:hypothetical protein
MEEVTAPQAQSFQLLQLEEQRENALESMTNKQHIAKKYFDHSATTKHFQKD